MTVPTGTFQRHTAVGAREDLEDIIYDISPTDTPFMTNIDRISASAVLHEWQVDALASASATNAQIEGDDATTNAADVTSRLGNYCQISTKVPRVSGTLRAANTAGRRDELSYQISKRARELKNDMESALIGVQAGTAGAAASARALAGAGCWIATNQVLVTTAAGSAPTTGTATLTSSGVPNTALVAGTSGTLLESNLKSAVKKCWDQGGDPTIIMCGSFNKQQISGFAGIGTLYRDAQPGGALKPGSIIGAADVYVSDFGTHSVVANRFQTAGNVYVLDMEYWAVAYYRPVQTVELAKTGDSDRRMLLAEYTLVSRNQKASALISATVTS